MIISYMLVSGASESEIEERVNQSIKTGWQPQGGISFIPETKASRMWYAQALVLDDGH